MKGLDVSTVVHLPPEPVYEFLVDFPRYGDYSEYLEEIRRDGDGGPGTAYDITVSWWQLRQTVRSEVTAVDPPERIDWRLTDLVDAHGAWELTAVPDRAPPAADGATVVTLAVRYDPDSVGTERLELPGFLPLDVVVGRVGPAVTAEAEATVERVVADLEGAPRDVELVVNRPSGAG